MMDLQPTARWEDDEVSLFVLTQDLVDTRYVRWLNDPDIARYLESRFVPHDMASTRAFVAKQHSDPRVLFLGIHSKPLDRHVGNIKLGPIDGHHGSADIGIMIGERDAWGRGIATRAIRLLCHVAQFELGLRKLTAGCYASNVGSQRAFLRAGFSIEGKRLEQYILDGLPEDLVIMGRVLGLEKKDPL